MTSPKASSSSTDTSKSSILRHLIEFDRAWSLYIHTKWLFLPRVFLTALEVSGNGLFWIPATVSMWLTPLSGFSKLRWVLFNVFIGFIFDLVLIGCLKYMIRRPRPLYNKGMYLVVSVDHWSFPSGHASRACFIGTFFWLCLPILQQIWVQMGLNYGVNDGFINPISGLGDGFIEVGVRVIIMWSIATSTSRILLGRHYALDVIAGASLGVLEALIVYKLFFVPEWISETAYFWIVGNACRHEVSLLRFVGSVCKGLNASVSNL